MANLNLTGPVRSKDKRPSSSQVGWPSVAGSSQVLTSLLRAPASWNVSVLLACSDTWGLGDYFPVNRAISCGSHECLLGFFQSPLSLRQSSSLSHGVQERRSNTALLPSAIPSEHPPSLLGVLSFCTTPCLLPLGAPVRTRAPTLADSPGPCACHHSRYDMPSCSPNPSPAQGGTTCLALPCHGSPNIQPWLSWNSIYRPGWPQAHRGLPAPASQMLGLKASSTILGYFLF